MRWIYKHPRIYDFLDTVVSFSLSDRVRRQVLQGLAACRYLEIGVGSGKALGYPVSDLSVGLDTSRQMLDAVRSHFPQTKLVLGDAHRLPLKDQSVDVSVFSYCLAVVADPVKAVEEALRVSTKVIVIDFDSPSFIPRLLWERVLTRLGRKVFGSSKLDFDKIAALGKTDQVKSFYGRLYRVITLDGAADARD